MKLLALVPLAYMVLTRIHSFRDLAYLAATQIVPGIIVLAWFGPDDELSAIPSYLLGYVAFVSIYELGYLVNDTWDAKRSASGSQRFEFTVTSGFCVAFIAIRLVCFSILILTVPDSGDVPALIAAFIALSIIFAAHNISRSIGVKLATFTQLTLLRFVLPILVPLGTAQFSSLLFIALLFYLPFRLLAYLDSKSKLQMHERRDTRFGLGYVTATAPVCFLLSYLTGDFIFALMWAFQMAVNLIYLGMGKLSLLRNEI